MSEKLPYPDGAAALSGQLYRPVGSPRAMMLVLPTIANITPAVAAKAQALADAGYLALVADFYGAPVADFATAQALGQALRADVDTYRQRLFAGLAALRGLPGTAGLPAMAIGFCMGGQAALELARAGADLAAVVSYHGILTTARPAAPGAVKARVLVCHGDADPLAPRDHVVALWQELDAADAQWHFHSYGGVRHGFTDPEADARSMAALAYNASADRQSWAATLALFDEVLSA